MKKILLVLLLLFAADLYSNSLPFNLEIEQVTMPGSPVIHSFAYAQSNGKWLLIGGRTNGLHGFMPSNAFPRTFANKNIFVVDPETGQTWSRSLYSDLSIQAADPLRSTNMQSFQKDGKLYLTGGYGIDTTVNDYRTFPVLSVIDVEETIQAIINNTSISSYVRQTADSRIQVCGGEMESLGDYVYLTGGHKFTGAYSQFVNDQVYTNEIKKFKIIDTGTTVSITEYTTATDTNEFHRRDLNLVPGISPSGNPMLIIYGGVFTPQTLPYLNPIYIEGNNITIDQSFEQKMSQYTCAFLPVFDASRGDLHTTFFGGTSLYFYNEVSSQLERDTLVPFIKDITTLSKHSNGTSEEILQPFKFSELLGTNARFISERNIPQYENGVIKLNEITGRTLAGYIFGGIRAVNMNMTPSYASDRVFKVYITPKSINITQINTNSPQSFKLSQNFPNPFNPSTAIRFDVPKAGNVKLKIFNSVGQQIETLVKENLSAGSYEVKWFGENYGSGIYFYRLEAEGFFETKKMMLVK